MSSQDGQIGSKPLWRKLFASIVTSEKLASCSFEARWLWALLVVVQDNRGYYPLTKTKLRSLIVGTEWTIEFVHTLLQELESHNLVKLTSFFSLPLVTLVQGAEKNGKPSNSKTDFLYTVTDEAENKLSQSSEQTENKLSQTRQDKTVQNKTVIEPAFQLLGTLEGFKSITQKQKDIITVACESHNVSVADIVKEFVGYWKIGQIAHGWVSPPHALSKTITVQIGKYLKGKNNGRHQISADQSSTTSKDRLDFRNRINAN
jgi:hypothetical protein